MLILSPGKLWNTKPSKQTLIQNRRASCLLINCCSKKDSPRYPLLVGSNKLPLIKLGKISKQKKGRHFFPHSSFRTPIHLFFRVCNRIPFQLHRHTPRFIIDLTLINFGRTLDSTAKSHFKQTVPKKLLKMAPVF